MGSGIYYTAKDFVEKSRVDILSIHIYSKPLQSLAFGGCSTSCKNFGFPGLCNYEIIETGDTFFWLFQNDSERNKEYKWTHG